MHLFAFLSQFILGAVGSNIGLSLSIVLGTFLLEDPTTILVGVLVADNVIPMPLALTSLYVGVVIGDIALYGLGWLASKSPRLARYVNNDLTVPFRTWLETRYVLTLFSARFIPGARLPTYAATGFFRSPFLTFVLVAIVATPIWISLLFFASYSFGNLTAAWVGPVRWGIAVVVLAALFLIGRHNIRAYRKKKATKNNP